MSRLNAMDPMRKRVTPKMVAVVMVLGLTASACYLPRANVDRPVESRVLVAVYRCSASAIGGEISNDNDVPIIVSILLRWLDADRMPFHEVKADPVEIPPNSIVEWEAQPGAEIERPQFCETETVSIEVSS